MTNSSVDRLGPVRRSLRTVTRDGDERRLLTVERTYDAPPQDVWDALTDPDRIARWLAPVTGEFSVGGHYAIEGNASGEILDCEEPERLALTWEYGGHVSWVDVSLRPTDGGTLLQLDHTAPTDDEQWQQFGPGAVGIGWEMALMGVALHLTAPDAARVEVPPDLGDLLRESSDAWAEASVEAGTDATQARAAAARCLDAYTGGTSES